LWQVFNEDRKQINGLLLIHLPDGPTAQFRLSNLVLSDGIKVRKQLPGACLGLHRSHLHRKLFWALFPDL
jgi:rRNA maturation protein Rpf1